MELASVKEKIHFFSQFIKHDYMTTDNDDKDHKSIKNFNHELENVFKKSDEIDDVMTGRYFDYRWGSVDSGHFSNQFDHDSYLEKVTHFHSNGQVSPSINRFYHRDGNVQYINSLEVLELTIEMFLDGNQTSLGFSVKFANCTSSYSTCRLFVEDVLPGSPSYYGGLMKNDEIFEVGEMSVCGLSRQEIIDSMSRFISSKFVRLKVKRRFPAKRFITKILLDREPTQSKKRTADRSDNNVSCVIKIDSENQKKLFNQKSFNHLSDDDQRREVLKCSTNIDGKSKKRASESSPILQRPNDDDDHHHHHHHHHRQDHNVDFSHHTIHTHSHSHFKSHQSDHPVSFDPHYEQMTASGFSSTNDNRLKIYDDDIRKKRDAERKQSTENEFLRTSLRGSKKLQSLAQSGTFDYQPTSHSNDAFQTDNTNVETDDDHQLKNGHCDELTNVVKSIEQFTADCQYDAENLSSGSLDFIDPIILGKTSNQRSAGKITAIANAINLELQHSDLNTSPISKVKRFLDESTVKTLFETHDEITAKLSSSNEPPTFSQSTYNSIQGNYYKDYGSLPFVGLMETCFNESNNETCLKIVKLIRDGDLPLGATVKNEGQSIVVSRVIKGGIVDKSGLLKEGDEILDVNGTDVRGKSVNEVCDLLATLSDELTFVVLPAPMENCVDSEPKSIVNHFRALFDYDPDDDPYLPCRELGFQFRKGEILHVISKLDNDWWQALRDDEEPQSLAGLIPSSSLQEQRIQYDRKHFTDDSIQDESGQCANSLLICTRGLKDRSLSSGRRKNRSRLPDLEHCIHTYEEVGLYLSPKGKRRPLVLVGPPNVGCLELRQRLIEYGNGTFAGVVPHTTRLKCLNEEEGVRYHFLTKAQFQENVNCMKFVEWGEYQKHYYGTSFDSIRKIIDQGKTCVLSLKVQSVKNLRNAEFMPFVVFVSPPSLERLRFNKKKELGKDVKADELKQIIYEAKEMEYKYGHYFDKILINNDVEKLYQELKTVVYRLETQPHWVPIQWLKNSVGLLNKKIDSDSL